MFELEIQYIECPKVLDDRFNPNNCPNLEICGMIKASIKVLTTPDIVEDIVLRYLDDGCILKKRICFRTGINEFWFIYVLNHPFYSQNITIHYYEPEGEHL